MIWHWIEAVTSVAIVLVTSQRRRFSLPGRLLTIAVLCAVGSFTSVLGYRSAWQTGCWVLAGVLWLLAFWWATRRRARARARAAAQAAEEKWRRWQEACEENGWH